MTRLALAVPILPGKQEAWRHFRDQLAGPRFPEFVESRRRLRIREVSFHQQTPDGEFLIITWEGEFVAWALLNMGAGEDDFTNWFVDQVRELHGFDLRQPPPGELPEEVVDSGALTDQNKMVVRRFITEVLNAHDADAAPEIFADNYQNHLPWASTALDLNGTRAALRTFFSAFPDMRIESGSFFAEDHMVATRITITGTHQGDFQGIPATGKRIEVSGSPQWRVLGGQIIEDWPSFDLLSLLKQLRAIPQADGAGA
jgi:steroid delta-isomerase-like uncharacterized protein